MKPLKRKEVYAETIRSAVKAFKDSTIVRHTVSHDESEFSWTLRGKFHGSTQVHVTGTGSVVVHGDYYTVVFMTYRGRNLLNAIPWVAQMDVDTLGAKAMRGMGVDAAAYESNNQVALLDLHGIFQDLWQERDHSKDEREELREWISAIRNLGRGDPIELVAQEINREIPDSWELVGDLGRVVSDRVLYAQQLVVRLHQLIQEKPPPIARKKPFVSKFTSRPC